MASARQQHAVGWKPPALTRLSGTTLGSADAAEFFGPRGRFAVQGGKVVPVPEGEWRRLRAEEQFDALLYLGPGLATEAEPLSARLCAEPGYVDMRLKRIALAGLPPVEVERVKKLCADK
jgi:hypothetical protein